MDERLKPVAVGLGAGVLSFVLPDGFGAAVVIASALLAGWVFPNAPMTAALLFLAPTLLLGAIRLLIDDVDASIGALGLAIVGAVFFTAIFTHLGSGLALRVIPRSR